MSDSEDDFMSDKFLVPDGPAKPARSYADKRKAAEKKHLASQPRSLKVREEEARRKALETSLFDDYQPTTKDAEPAAPQPGAKAMNMMLKMGWKVGEGLGRKGDDIHEPVNPEKEKGQHGNLSDEETEPAEREKAGLGMASRKRRRSTDSPAADEPSTSKQRVEPIRISRWAGKTGLGARIRSPSPVLAPGELHPARLAELATSTDDFRKRQAGENEAKKIEGREWAARKLLVELDEKRDVKFHPLHIIPSAPAQTIPTPLLRLIFLEDSDSLIQERRSYLARRLGAPSGGTVGIDDTYGHSGGVPSGSYIKGRGKDENMSQAQRLKEMMQRDMLQEVEGDEEGEEDGEGKVVFAAGYGGVKLEGKGTVKDDDEDEIKDEVDIAPINWEEQVDGVKRVLAMDPETHLSFLLDFLRADHHYCFWCGFKYGSQEEMDAVGGCPGEEEDDH